MPLYVYERPRRDGVYVMGLDPAGGRGGDPAALVVMDAEPGRVREVALFRSRWCDYGDLARLAWDLHQEGYRVALGGTQKGYERSGGLVPEANNEALMQALDTWFLQAHYYQQRRPATPQNPQGAVVRYGFWTTPASKAALLDGAREALECRAFQQSDRYLGLEAPYWDRRAGRWEFEPPALAPGDLGHGDVTIATALALEGVRAVQQWLETRRRAAGQPPPENAVYCDWGPARERRDPLVEAMLEGARVGGRDA